MYQNAIYICISWYNKICWFPVKKCWYQQNSRVCHVIHIFFGSSLGKVQLPSFIIVRYVWQIIGRWGLPPHPWAAPKMPILNRVKIKQCKKLMTWNRISKVTSIKNIDLFIHSFKVMSDFPNTKFHVYNV